MPIFNNSSPLVEYAINPKYATGFAKTRLAMLGYNSNGQQNAIGKISSWVPGLNILNNIEAKHVAEKSGAKTSAMNIGEDFDNRVDKLGIEAGVVQGLVGGFTGNPEQLLSGLKTATTYTGSLAFDQNDIQEGDSIYI
jgi:hypothetical protein